MIIAFSLTLLWYYDIVEFQKVSNFETEWASQQEAIMAGPQTRKIWDSEDFVIVRDFGRYGIIPKEEYIASVKVMNRKYYDDDNKISPVDLMFAWGEVADPTKCEGFITTMGNRFANYRYTGCDFSNRYITTHASNNHIIPASENISIGIDEIVPGDIVRVEGYLVNVQDLVNTQRNIWKTSTTRTDSGLGACEILYLKRIVNGNKTYS